MKQQKIGIVGLGLVGMALTERFNLAGITVFGHDIRAQAATDFVAKGNTWCAELSDLAGCQVLIMAVFQTSDVLSVVQVLKPEWEKTNQQTIIIDCSTGEPQQLEVLAKALKALNIDFLEAPLSGSSQQIAAGQATMLLGGATETIAACAYILDILSQKRIHTGGVGMGAKAKLATNLVLGLNRAVLAEGMAFAESQGIAADAFLEMVLDSPARSEAAVVKGKKMTSGDFAPQSRIRQHLKDLEVMLNCAALADQGLPFTRQHAAILRASVAAGEGDLDNAAILKQLRREKP